MEPADPAADYRLCALCCELDASGGRCTGGHDICDSCVAACTLVATKLIGGWDFSPVCPVPACEGIMLDPTLASPSAPRRLGRLVRLRAGGPEYADIAGAFGETMDAGKVRAIYRVDNPALRAIYEACRERMNKEGRCGNSTPKPAGLPMNPRIRRGGVAVVGVAPDDPRNVGANEKRLFHATTRFASGAIVREGFDAHRAGQANGVALGPGIYVATDASFSHRYSSEDSVGTRVMLVCSVLLGDTSGRDSRCDSGARPAQYAVHREQQVLPTHVVIYDC